MLIVEDMLADSRCAQSTFLASLVWGGGGGVGGVGAGVGAWIVMFESSIYRRWRTQGVLKPHLFPTLFGVVGEGGGRRGLELVLSCSQAQSIDMSMQFAQLCKQEIFRDSG